jgi:hypothetical protein
MPRSEKGLKRPAFPRGFDRWLRDAAASLAPTEASVLAKLRELCEAAYEKDNVGLLPSAKELAAAGDWGIGSVRRIVKALCDDGSVVRIGAGAQTRYVLAEKVYKRT